jgi:hypothetical protein
MSEGQLRERLHRSRPCSPAPPRPGKRVAAEAVLTRARPRLAEARRTAAAIEPQFSITASWSRQLFVALAQRYGLRPYRYPRQRRTTVMLQAPESFLRGVLWPEFETLNEALVGCLAEVTARIIRDEVHGKTGDAEERAEPGRLG